MAGIQLSGLASGLDWKSLVGQLIEVQRSPQKTLRTEQSTNTSKTNALNEIKSLLTNLQGSITNLSAAGGFQQRSAKIASSTSTWSAASAAGGTTGTYAFNVSQLATSAKRTGTSDVGSGIAATNDVSGSLISALRTNNTITAGEFTVNGAKVTIATTDTLQDVFTRINTATGGSVTASYDAGTDRVSLSSGSAIQLGSAADTSNFLGNMKLYTNGTGSISSTGNLGVTKLTVPLVDAGLKTALTGVDGSGNGSFTINGKSITYNVNTDSIQTVLSKINSSSAGVTASYDSSQDRFVLANTSTGNTGLYTEETGTGFLAATGITGGAFASGTNAVFTVNGSESITSTSNTFDATAHGITGLSVTADAAGAQTVTVAADATSAKAKIDDVISKYNSIQAAIDKYTKVTVSGNKVTSAILAGDSNITSLSAELRAITFGAGTGLTGSVQRLSNIGIDFSSTSSDLAVRDSTLLASKLANSAVDVEDYFTNATTGLGKRLTDFITKRTSDTGSIATQTTNLTKRNTAIDTQIAEMERQLTSQQSLLEASFIQMESSQSKYQQQGTLITNAFK